MIAAVVPPRRCRSCETTWPSCMDKREYQSLPCCRACDHDDRVRTCAGCAADEFICARKASNGGRVCCESCPHVVARAAPKRAVANRQPPAKTHPTQRETR